MTTAEPPCETERLLITQRDQDLVQRREAIADYVAGKTSQMPKWNGSWDVKKSMVPRRAYADAFNAEVAALEADVRRHNQRCGWVHTAKNTPKTVNHH